MLITLYIPSKISPIEIWNEISPLLFIRSFVWLLGLLMLLGLYVLRLTGLGQSLSILENIVVGINLSFVLLGVISVILYNFGGIGFLPWFLLAFLFTLTFIYWNKKKFDPLMKRLMISKWNLLLLFGVIATIFLAFYFQFNKRYQLPGDLWVSLKPAVQIISQRNVYDVFKSFRYPLMFGHILSGLSVCLGLPIVNIYVLLFPLSALNLLSFFIFVRIVFKLNDKKATLAALFYGFGAGFGLLVQFLGFNGELGFRSLTYLTYDFSLPNTYTVLFYYKSLALTQAYTSIVCFIIATDLENNSKTYGMIISVFLLIFAFYIHMIEAIIFYPMIFLTAYIYKKRWKKHLLLYSLIFLFILLGMDILMEGFYFWLIFNKISGILSIITIEKVLLYFFLLLGGCFIIFLSIRIKNHLEISDKYTLEILDNRKLGKIKLILVLFLLSVYIYGLVFWKTPTPKNILPWYRYVTRYGIIGILTLIGVAKTEWKEKWFLLLSFWFLYIIFLGRLFNGSYLEGRIHTIYVIPLMATFASQGFFQIWKNGKNFKLKISPSNTSSKIKYKQIIIVLIVSFFIYSSISTTYATINYHGSINPSLSDDEVKTLIWINENTSYNTTILVPNIYSIYRGVDCISDREIYNVKNLPVDINNLNSTLREHNINYILTITNQDETSILTVLLSNSNLVFKSGDVKLFRIYKDYV
jgi:hypothetical protein